MLLILHRLLKDESGATRLEHTLLTLLTSWAAFQLVFFVGEKFAYW